MSLAPEQCAELVRRSSCTVAMTGAGISTAAGVPDFRSADGIYSRYPHSTFEIGQFRRDPGGFFRFTRELFDAAADVQPTRTHTLLADWESRGHLAAVITQNIDPLHHMAGSKNVLAVHGSYGLAHCTTCGREYPFETFAERVYAADVPCCDCDDHGVIKPDVVFFGETVRCLEEAMALATSCELMLVLGSSLAVQPAALLPSLAAGTVVAVNRGPIAMDAAPNRFVVESDIDEYFSQVARALEA